MKKHIIFDFDGTLVNSHDHNQQMFIETFLPHFPNVDQERLRAVHEATVGEAMSINFEKAKVDLALDFDIEQFVLENEEIHKKNFEKIVAFPKVEEFLEQLTQKNKILHICTNRNTTSFIPVLKKYNLEKYFQNVISCIDEGFAKPHPQTLNDLVQKNGGNKSEFVYIGDSYVDKSFAMNAEIDFIILDHKTHDKKFFEMILGVFM